MVEEEALPPGGQEAKEKNKKQPGFESLFQGHSPMNVIPSSKLFLLKVLPSPYSNTTGDIWAFEGHLPKSQKFPNLTVLPGGDLL
jgi:hypothetical protein